MGELRVLAALPGVGLEDVNGGFPTRGTCLAGGQRLDELALQALGSCQSLNRVGARKLSKYWQPTVTLT